MIRVVFYLVIVGLLALGTAWLADRPGDVVITWLGYRIETSVMVLICAVALIAAVAIALWSLVRFVLRSPDLIAMVLRNRRGARGYQAISRGLIAVGSGDARTARKLAEEANRIAPSEPLTLLLNAQTAQLNRDPATAERVFRAMAARQDTKLIGLHGLYVEAQRRADTDAARACAEEAAKTAPALAWAGQAVLGFRCGAGDWDGALARLDANMHNRLIDRATYQRQRAVLLTARAQAAEEIDPGRARADAAEAVKLEPTLVPAAALAGRLLAEAGELRKASRTIERAWRANPHPELAEVLAHLRYGDSARDRLGRIESLAQKTPGHPEAAIALAHAALDAQEFARAREALAPLTPTPTRRVALLMAAIEEREHGDEGRAREWMARAVNAAPDPAWTADGIVSDHWLPVSPVSGRLDAFTWRVPVEDLGGPVIESQLPGATATLAELRDAVGEPAHDVETVSEQETPEEPPREREAETPPQQPAALTHDEAPSAGPRTPPAPVVEPVIPLVHAPDDPGPEPEPEGESLGEPPPDGWRRLFR